MRKFTLLIASLLFTIGAMAQFETGKEYRIKVVDGDAAGEYVTIGDNLGKAFGYVHTMALDENNADQKFTFVSSNGNWKVKSVNEEYFAHTGGTGEAWNDWNLNKTTNESSATEVIFVSTGTENEYYLRANTTQYFKVGGVEGGGSDYKHVYYDAAEGARTKFAVEEINASPVADGVYTIDNIYNSRGSMCYGTWNGTEYFGLTNITLSNYEGNSLTVDPVANKYWYVKTTERGIYFYNIGKGYFLQEQSATKATCAEGAANGFTFEERTANSTNYISVKDGDYYLSYSCGWAPNSTDGSVRWIADSEAAATLFTFTAVADAATTYATEIATADEKIAAFEADVDEAKAALRAKLDVCKNYYDAGLIGEHGGQYSSELDFVAIYEAGEAYYATIVAETEVDAVEVEIAKIQALIDSFRFNMPVSGEVYTIQTADRGWLVASSSADYVWSSMKTGIDLATPSAENEYCQWVVYTTTDGTYMYNVGSGKFITVGNNDNSIPFGDIPNSSAVVFANSAVADYPIIIGFNNKAVNLNLTSGTFTYGALLWGDGWTDHTRYNDPGSCMKMTYVKNADAETLANITKQVSAYEDAPFTLTVTDAGYATLFLGFDAAIPTFEGEENGVYIVKEDGINENYIHLEAVTGVLPANTGVIVKANPGTYAFAYSAETKADVAGNLLAGSVADEYVEGAAYVLGNKNGVGLYKAEMNQLDGTAWLNNANKAYLPAVAGSANVASYSFRFGEGTTGIDQITDNREQSTVIYDLTGRCVESISAPGIYIVNGKKVLVK